MLVVHRFRVPGPEADEFRARAEQLHALLAGSRGCATGSLGRNIDDPGLWALTTTWADVGSYRRALSAHRVAAMGVMQWAIDEPSAYELVEPGRPLNSSAPRGT